MQKLNYCRKTFLKRHHESFLSKSVKSISFKLICAHTGIDECSGGNHTCDIDRATCTNTIGSYKCACKYGYDGDGETCIAPGKRRLLSLSRKNLIVAEQYLYYFSLLGV